MEKIRIGKDITFVWQVRKDGEALTAEDAANLTLEIAGRNGKSQRLPFEIRDSKIIAAWYGVQQTEIGAYRLTCWHNRGKVGESVVDVVWAVELVRYTTEETFDDIETVTIELEGGNLTFAALKGASAYEVAVAEGFVGTEAEWLASLKKPAEDAAEDAEEAAARAIEAAENAEASSTRAETAAQTAENAAGDANTAAGLANSAADNAEAKAQLADAAADNANTAANEAYNKAQEADTAATTATNAAQLANSAAASADEAARGAVEAAVEATESAENAQTEAGNAHSAADYANEMAIAAERVNAQLNGNVLTVTNRQGTSTSVNTKGEQGEQGDPGQAATISVGTTITGAPGTDAQVTNSGTASAAVLDFTIPQGPKGDKGDQGEPGEVTEAEMNAALALKEDKVNKVTEIDDNSTDVQYPSAKAVNTALNSKVDKVTNKGLSTEDYTTVEKGKLNDLPSAQETNAGITYDVSVMHPTSGVDGGNTYASLSSALAVIPQNKRRGGMTVKFVLSSNNEYVQYFLTKNTWSAVVDYWERVDLDYEINGQKHNLEQSVNTVQSYRSVTLEEPLLAGQVITELLRNPSYQAVWLGNGSAALNLTTVTFPYTLTNNYTTVHGSADGTVTFKYNDGTGLPDSTGLVGDVKSLQEDNVDIHEEINLIENGADETQYENEGEWEHYAILNKWTGWQGTGTYTPALEEETKINCIYIPTFKAQRASNVKYFIGYGLTSPASFNPSALSLLKSGTLNVTPATDVANTKVYLETPVTIPAGNQVIVLLYAKEGGVVICGGGDAATESSLPYNNKVPRALLNTSTTAWDNPFATTWYMAVDTSTDRWKVCSPILRFEYDLVKGKINEILPNELQEQVPPIVEEVLEEDRHVDIYLPNRLYAVVGDTLQIFFHSIVDAIDIEQYDIYASCNKGKTYPRYFSYTPTVDDIGTTTLTIYVKDRVGRILGQGSCSIVTAASPTSPATQKSIFTFGDSLTSNGIWVGEAKRRLVNTSTYDSIEGKGLSNLSFFGYMSNTIHSQLVDFFGVGGWTWANYLTKATGGAFRFYVEGVSSISIGAIYTNNGHSYTVQEINITGNSGNIRCTTSANTDTPSSSGTLTKTSGDGDATITFASFEAENANPLWDDANNKMSFIPYVQDCGANTIDAVYVLLTWNGHAAWKEYSVDDTTGNIANAKIFARTLHTEYPSAKLFIMGIQMPSDTGGLGANYGASGGYIDGYGLKKCALSYNKALQDLCNLDEFSSYCEFVAIAPQFDTHYNMPFVMSKVNTRNSTTEMLGTNGVHPSEQGYNQIADAVYRSIVANFCQST